MRTFFLSLCTFLAIAASAPAADPIEFSVGSFSFERPEGWTWVQPASPMRKAQLGFQGKDGACEITFFHFGAGQGGGVQANIDRWFNQFKEGTTDTKTETVGKTQVTFVKAEGTFMSGMPGGQQTPMTGYGMRGAILASEGGDVFIKMTGPESAVKEAEPAFDKLVRQAAK